MKILIPFLYLLSFSLSAREFYLSNSLAMELSRADDNEMIDRESIEWLLEKEEEGNQSLSILYNFGVEKTRFIREYHSNGSPALSMEISKGVQIENIEYRSDGRISRSTSYDSEGRIDRVRRYFYSSEGVLLRIEIENGAGVRLSSMEYHIRKDGTIRSVFIHDDQSINHSEIWNAYGGSLFMEQRSHDSMRELVYYNQKNQISKVLHYEADQLLYEETYTYSGLNILQQVEKKNYLKSETIIQTMNEAGDVLSEILYIDGVREHTIKYIYGDGKLVIKEKSGPSLREKWAYSYANDKLSEEEYYKQGILIQKKIITDWENDFYTIEFYNKGEVFLNLVYENDIKIRELFLENGQVVRSRDLGDL